jgi:hypothetical protein
MYKTPKYFARSKLTLLSRLKRTGSGKIQFSRDLTITETLPN